DGGLRATNDFVEAIHGTDVSLCCVGTPSREDGSLDTSYVKLVSEQIGRTLRHKDEFHTVIMRSTILPGTMEQVVIPALQEASGKVAGKDFGVGYYPEFLRESTAIEDYFNPGAIVFGQYEDDIRSVDVLHALCANIDVKPLVIDMRSAEIVKYANNCWHAAKISFSNEIGNLCKSVDIDSHKVMEVVCADRRLNISPAYMKPGFAFGGSCLPKDLRALRYFGRSHNVQTPMLDASVSANENQLKRAYDLVRRSGKQRVGLLGITFKADTDDLRESPLVILAERLLGTGHDLSIYDPNVTAESNGGRNYIRHLAQFMRRDPESVLRDSETVVIGNSNQRSQDALSHTNKPIDVIDLARVSIEPRSGMQYQGICW
ncbi:MAG: nucleotide sugar dehydrogenase, partial [Pseudomonadota bacterium]